MMFSVIASFMVGNGIFYDVLEYSDPVVTMGMPIRL